MMAVTFRSRFSMEAIFRYATWLVASFALCVGLFYSFSKPKARAPQTLLSTHSEKQFPQICTGPLALKENLRPPLAISMEQRLVLLARSSRPDLPKEERVISLGIAGSEEKWVAKEGSPIYLSLELHESGGVEKLGFSKEPTGWMLLPKGMQGKVLGLRLEGEATEPIDLLLEPSFASSGTLESLETAAWVGSDLLFCKYGGKEYGPLGKKEKIEVASGEKSYFLYVSKGDYLTLEEGRWRVLPSLQEADRSKILARVCSAQSDAIWIEGWDVDGFSLFETKLASRRESPYRPQITKILTDTRARSNTQVSCLLDKKRMTLAEGDWLLQSKAGWQKLKTLSEIEAVLSHELKGELLVIDEVEPRGALKGHLFNEMRTAMHPFVIPIRQGKPSAKKMIPRRK